MEHFTTIKILHVVATVLFLLSAVGLAGVVIKKRRSGDTTVQNRLLQRPWLFIWLLMGLCLLIMPVSGWWLVHYAGWSLGQTWLLASSVLYTLGTLSWAWLVARLNRLRTAADTGPSKIPLVLAIFSAVCFIAIAGLMGAKPV
ncbi:DUF2269 domain-containing protein [Pseudomonas sp. DWP3-1-2]|uniref:DUF2269 domain-containing protein n=1 Tax=Pseudomonas sp. DWP3-1-2 TaxID=2804645 RepID=UPI003CFA020E